MNDSNKELTNHTNFMICLLIVRKCIVFIEALISVMSLVASIQNNYILTAWLLILMPPLAFSDNYVNKKIKKHEEQYAQVKIAIDNILNNHSDNAYIIEALTSMVVENKAYVNNLNDQDDCYKALQLLSDNGLVIIKPIGIGEFVESTINGDFVDAIENFLNNYNDGFMWCDKKQTTFIEKLLKTIGKHLKCENKQAEQYQEITKNKYIKVPHSKYAEFFDAFEQTMFRIVFFLGLVSMFVGSSFVISRTAGSDARAIGSICMLLALLFIPIGYLSTQDKERLLNFANMSIAFISMLFAYVAIVGVNENKTINNIDSQCTNTTYNNVINQMQCEHCGICVDIVENENPTCTFCESSNNGNVNQNNSYKAQ